MKKKKVDWQKRAEEYLKGWQRTRADFLNYKRQVEESREEWQKTANENLILRILPILDGLEIVVGELKKALGVKEVKTKKFDPALHEAVGGEGEEIVEVVQKGYQVNDKLLRPAKVRLGLRRSKGRV
jgi:molecular chaperone GrpE